jgi:DNA-binding LacI/PurR family transcriptional regulator
LDKRYASSMDVARLAGVSQSAVSRTYTVGASVSPKTREKVLEAARKLGYRPNLLPQALMRNRSRLVGMVVGGITNPFYASVLERFTRALQNAGQQVMLIQIDSDYALDTVIDRIAGYRVDAIVSALAVLSADTASALADLRIPVVCFNGRIRAPWVSSVSTDNIEAGAAAADHLHEVGGTRFAFVGGPPDSPAAEDRRQGFICRLQHWGAPAPLVLPGDYSYECGRALAQDIRAHKPDAVACANDLAALGVLDALRQAGLHVPADIRVLGYDNVGMDEWTAYQLTSFDQDIPEMIRRSLRLILNEDAAEAARQGVLELVPARLIARQTTIGSAAPGR